MATVPVKTLQQANERDGFSAIVFLCGECGAVMQITEHLHDPTNLIGFATVGLTCSAHPEDHPGTANVTISGYMATLEELEVAATLPAAKMKKKEGVDYG